MTVDTSKIAHMELRQTLKPLIEQYEGIENEINKLYDAKAALSEKIDGLAKDAGLDWRGQVCDETHLPIFEEDDTMVILAPIPA